MRYLLITAMSICSAMAFAQAPEKLLEVIVQPVAFYDLQNTIEALGELRANESAVITSKVSKTITRIHFDDGQLVSKGDLLVEMTNAEEAALMEEARLTADEAKKQLDRVKNLAKTGAVSAAQLDEKMREYGTARAHFIALQQRYNDLLIKAPFSGTLGIRTISEGALVAPGQVITTINDDSTMKLDFTVPANALRSVRIGLPLEARSHDLGNKMFNGAIVSIDNQMDEVSRSIRVRARLKNSQHELKQGLLMTVNVHADQRQALVISEAALVPMGSDQFVFVLKPQAEKKWIAEKRQIHIGQRYQGSVEVIDGLQEGEKVVTHGLQKIHAGQPLSVLAEEPSVQGQASVPLSELLQQKKKEGK